MTITGGQAMPVRTYPALAGFYAADRRRKDSRELDLGLAWRERNGFPTFRAAWVADTGEVYLVQHGPWPGGGQVTVLAEVADRRTLMHRLAGWREQVGRHGSLDWLRAKLDTTGQTTVGLLAGEAA